MEQDKPYRWIIVLIAAVFLGLVMGQIINGVAVFLIPLESGEGWDRAEVAAINTIGLFGLAVGGLFLSHLAERYGTRRVVLTGVAVFGVAMALASYAQTLWQLYLAFFIAGVAGGGAVNAPLLALVSNWFTRGGGLALGLLAAGQAMGQGGVPFTGALLIEAFGWRGAFIAQGLIAIGILVPLVLFLRPPPVPATHAGTARSATGGFLIPEWQAVSLIGVASTMCCVCMSVPLIHLVPLIQSCGYTAPQAGGLLFFMLMVAISGRVFFGWLSDRIGGLPAWMIASAWQTVMIFGFTMIDTLQGFYIFAALYGFGYGGVMTGVLSTTREFTPPQARARANGRVMSFAFAGHGIGGYQGGLFYGLTGGYGWSYANGARAGLVNLSLLLLLYMLVSRARARARPATVLA